MGKNSNHLNRHEQLRYEYLLKNLEYLTDREKKEFNYLYEKQMGYQEPYDDSYASYDDGYDSQDSYDNYYDDGYSNSEEWQEQLYSDDAYTPQGLPVYPDEEAKPRRAKKQEVQEPFYQEELPVYDQAYDYQEAGDIQSSQPRKKKKPKKPRRKRIKRILQVIALLFLLVIGGMVYMFYKGASDVVSGSTDYTAAVTEVFNGEDTEDGTNILILGSDQRITQGSSDARTDTIMVMNIGNSDGKIKLVSFMRDTLVNIEGVSYNDYSYDQKLNVAFNIGEQDNNQGAELMRETLKNNFDINIKYYVMLDFETFAEAIDTLFPDGVEIDAQFGTVDGEDVSSVEVPDD